MCSPYLLGDIARDEDLRLKAYPDPLSPRGREMAKPRSERCAGWEALPGDPWTIGHGHTGPEVHEGLIWTLEQASDALAKDAEAAKAELDKHLPWWRQLSQYRADVLVMMCFNMGWPRLSGFKRMIEALDDANYDRAADEMQASRWALQVGARAKRLATQMRTGVRA